VKYAFIRDHRDRYPIRRLCEVMELSSSAYYDWLKRPPSARAVSDAALAGELKELHYTYRQAYGTRRLQRELIKRGWRVGRRRVRRLKRLHGLWTRRRRRAIRHQAAYSKPQLAANRLAQRFVAAQPNQIWTADVTSVWTLQGWLHVAVVLDLYARRIVGWASDSRCGDKLTLAALNQALKRRRPRAGLLHHSDRGPHYTSRRYQGRLTQRAIHSSMSRPGNCFDNAPVESFFSTLKSELTHHRRFRTRDQAWVEIKAYIEQFYNRIRAHTSLGYRSPGEYEKMATVT